MASTNTTGAASSTTAASSTAEMWSQAAAAYQAYNNNWSNAAQQMYNTGNAAYSTNQWDASNTAYQTNWSAGTNTGATPSNYNTAAANQWYNQANAYTGATNTGTGTGTGNNQTAYTANTAAFSTNTGYVDQSSYNTEGYSTSQGYGGNQGYGNQGYGNQGYGNNQGYTNTNNKGNDQKGGRGFGNTRQDKGFGNKRGGGGGNSGGGGSGYGGSGSGYGGSGSGYGGGGSGYGGGGSGYGGGGRGGGGGMRGGDRNDRSGSGDRNRMGGGRDGGGGRMGGRFSDQGGRMGGGRDRDQAKRKDPFQGAPDLGRPYNPKRIKLDKDMSRMGNMIESSSSAINSLRRGWVDMDTKELNKKVEFLINQQMMLIDKQSQMAESLERREIDMHGEMELLLKERADMMRHLDETMRFGGGGRGFEDNFGPPLPGPMGQMGPPGPRWSRDNRDNSWISPEESVMRFTEYLLFFQPKSNNAQTLVRAVVSSRLNIKVEMRYKEIERDGEKVFRGHLLLGYFVLQHAYKKTLDELRSYLFDRSVYTLMTKTLGYIAVNSNRVMEAKKNEDRMIRGDEMCEVNGSEAVKIWSSKPDRERHRTDSTSKDKDDEKSEADFAKDVKKEEPESEDVKETKQEDAEMKDDEKESETETKVEIKQEDNEESKEEGKDGDDSKNLDESVDGSKDGDKGSRDRDSRDSRDRRDRRDRDRGDRRDRSRDRDRHGRQRKPRSEYKFFSPRLRERLEMMRDELPVGPHIRSIHDMSYAAKCNNVGITLTVYKRRPDDHLLETYDAELYADEIFLGRGHGRDVREAHKYAFIHSRDDILGAPMNELLSTRKRLIELNLNDPLLLDIQYRGPFHDVGNNMSNLKMAREWPLEKESDIADIIILEDQEDRKKNYYKTLEISATQNGMMLEWVRSGRDDTMPHRCQLYLEKTKIADVKSPNKLKAKNLAAFEALQLLKKTQTIIRYSIDSNKKPLFTFNDLKEQARLRHEADKEKKAAEGGENPAEEETTEVKEEESENMAEEKEEATEEGNDEETGGKAEDASEKGEDDKEDKDENKEDGEGDEKSGKKKETRAERKTRHYKERQKEREKEREREKRHEYLDKYMDEIIGEEIDKYLATDDMEGILLGPDLPQNTKRKVSNIAVEKGMLVMPCGSDDVILLNKETYLAPNMLRRLQEAGNQIGRYQIVQLKVEGSDKPLRLIEEEEDDGEEMEHGDDHKDDSHGQDDATPKKVKKTKEGDEAVEKNGNGEVESMEVDKSQ
ncbi:hypothetical protein SNE40_000880 [Patella caerulea]|uniref:DRBM domain-containing protein n=1 Tax=Patella caerulea TaxID=87958 RepID=A0AAN8KL21_PATCE